MRTSFLAICLLASGLSAGRLTAQQRPTRAAASPVTCDKCHADRDFLVGKGGPHGDSSLFVPATTLHGTAHDTLRCAQCHVGYDNGFPHQATSRVVPCQTCHQREGSDWQSSIHASNSRQAGDAPTCVGCHTAHTVRRATDPQSPSYVLNVATMCGRCHNDPRIVETYFSQANKTTARTAVSHFEKTVHGLALTRSGLTVSATCNDCHRAHLVLPADSARSSVNRANIPATCGACHQGVVQTFDSSAHGRAYAHGDTTDTGHHAPVCTDCHTSHEIVRADQPQWQLNVVTECGTCHERLHETYFETYHGKVSRLGYIAATCADCHTAHNMRPANDTLSSVYIENRVQTCGRCHTRANLNFVKYQPHGDPKDHAKYPLLFFTWLGMTLLLVGTMGFFFLHSLLWIVRVIINRMTGRGPAHSETPA